MKAQIKKEFTLILTGSLLTATFLSISWQFPLGLMVISTLLINFSLMLCMWYSERINRPILFQVLTIFYLGIAAYCRLSVNESEMMGVYYDGRLAAQISLLLVIGVFIVAGVGFNPLRRVVKSRIDLWLPPLWPVVVAGAACYVADKEMGAEALRMCVLIGMGGLILTTAYKNNHLQNGRVAYRITTRHYLRYIVLFSMMIFSVNQLIPKGEALPGTKLLKNMTDNWGKGFAGKIDKEYKLNRNPSQSEETVMYVQSEGAVYLRKMAYTSYLNGAWHIDAEDKTLTDLKEEMLYPEFDLFKLLLDKLERGEIKDSRLQAAYKDCMRFPEYTPIEKTAYIEEVKPFDHYFTINGFNAIEASDHTKVGYYQDVDNIYFSSASKEKEIGYTIRYKKYMPAKETREAAALMKMNETDFEQLLYKADLSPEEKTEEIRALIRKSEGYAALYDKYTALPEGLAQPMELYAEKITEGMTGDMEKALAICNRLKKSGVYTYKLGAAYQRKDIDPILDFLLYGKEGICQDFASGMVLLCRGAGLPSRYVTGYYSTERADDRSSSYNVRVKDAHAFAEVYIAGYGWMTFDPTPYDKGGTLVDDLPEAAVTGHAGGFEMGYSNVLLIVGLAAGMLLLWIYPVGEIKNWFMRQHILKLPCDKGIMLLMQQTLKLLEERGIYLESEETVSMLEKRLNSQGIHISPITQPFEAFYYGGKVPQPLNLERAVSCYQSLRKNKKLKHLVDAVSMVETDR